MVVLNTVIFIAILVGVWLAGYVACGLLALGGRSDVDLQVDLLTQRLIEKDELIKQLEEIKLQLEDRNKKLLDNIFTKERRAL